MHVLEIPSFFAPYGGMFCLDQAKALLRQGHEVRILSNVQLGVTVNWRDYLSLPYSRYEYESEGVAVLQSYQRGIPLVVRPNVRQWVSIVCDMFDDYVRQYGQPDVLHAHCVKWAGYAAMIISRKYHIPYVITEHQPSLNYVREFGPAPSGAWQIPLLKEALESAAKVICVAEEMVGEVACYFGRSYSWTFVSNLIDTDFYAYRQRTSVQDRPFRFVCPAIYVWRKGYDVLLAALDGMKEQNVELHVAGAGTDGAAFRRLLAKCQSANRVVVHGELKREAMRDLLWQCDAVALATRSEVQPLVLLEAMSTGIPYVSTEVVPRSERFEGAGAIVPVDDASALATAMDDMVKCVRGDGAAAAERGRYLSGCVSKMASATVVGRQLATILSEACKRYEAPAPAPR